ncbi:putative holin-like toxin [Radiobacillus kanasensis]|nr:putative holin-like toxin [Radiobacillus kanasensis]UFT98380.1 putative holin-like toxin [Radiobacillus kanasensis]
MNTVAVIFLVLFAGGTFLVALLEYIRKLINDSNKK